MKISLLKQFACKPKLLAGFGADWGASPPADTIARSHLKTKSGLNDQSSRSLLAIYKENLAFAEFKGGDKVATQHREQAADEAPNLILVGEHVQWAAGGIKQFPAPQPGRLGFG